MPDDHKPSDEELAADRAGEIDPEKLAAMTDAELSAEDDRLEGEDDHPDDYRPADAGII